jgi:hypothetical protein
MAYGTLSTLDTLATLNNTTVAQFGEDRLWESLDAILEAHNRIEAELRRDLVEVTTDNLRRYGADPSMAMDEIDEFARPDAQKITTGSNVGFPLRLFGISVQWTRKFMQNATPAEIAAQFTAAMTADTRRRNREIKRALFSPTNYTFVDRLVNRLELPVKALINADSSTIPPGPNGEAFNGASHTHYVARVSTLAASDVTAVITNAAEHVNSGEIRLYINAAQETAIRGFTSNFTAYIDARIIPASTAQVGARALDVMNTGDRPIGVFNQAEVWVKPWVPANYMVAHATAAGAPLAMRVRNAGGGGLELVADDELHPLRARTFEAEYGIGVWNRTAASILYVGGTSYSAPTLTD